MGLYSIVTWSHILILLISNKLLFLLLILGELLFYRAEILNQHFNCDITWTYTGLSRIGGAGKCRTSQLSIQLVTEVLYAFVYL